MAPVTPPADTPSGEEMREAIERARSALFAVEQMLRAADYDLERGEVYTMRCNLGYMLDRLASAAATRPGEGEVDHAEDCPAHIIGERGACLCGACHRAEPAPQPACAACRGAKVIAEEHAPGHGRLRACDACSGRGDGGGR